LTAQERREVLRRTFNGNEGLVEAYMRCLAVGSPALEEELVRAKKRYELLDLMDALRRRSS